LSPADIDAIVTLVALEDTRRFDEATLTALIKSPHPDVRRRAVQAVGRIAKPEGRPLLVAARGDADPEVVATVAFATGQLKDAESVVWLAEVLQSPKTPPAVAKEAACALGKMVRTPEARAALAGYLNAAPATPAAAPVVGEALLAIGRFTMREDIAPIVRWTASATRIALARGVGAVPSARPGRRAPPADALRRRLGRSQVLGGARPHAGGRFRLDRRTCRRFRTSQKGNDRPRPSSANRGVARPGSVRR
jgi:hypothetical protein